MNTPSLRRGIFRALVFFLTAVATLAAEPVQFVFRLPSDSRNPFSRELWAEIITPSRKSIRLPVFFYGSGQFAVRARATETGEYILRNVTEKTGDAITPLSFAMPKGSRTSQQVKVLASLPQVMGYRGKPSRFLFGDGTPFTPIGANVPWAPSDRLKYHLNAISEFSNQGLNWMRIWMAHWGGLNLDWVADDMGSPPARGMLDLRVAADWDRIVEVAEDKGIYVQMVLQHHGQYSTTVNPNWPQNPWNAANPGGFLAMPADFFSSETAIGLTALKYRYIIARWGYSPAIVAWELFNEVHWVDPIHLAHEETAVASWHTAMATYIRQVDHYHHLVTTSADKLTSALYEKIDYYQPHLYANNMLAAPRVFSVPPDQLERPVFYGEVGDDHMDLTDAQKNSGVAIVPPVWASLMGQGRYPAQPWLGEKLLAVGKVGELGAVARFIRASGLGRRENLTPFTAVVECTARHPFALAASQHWRPQPAPDMTVPLDGREPIELAYVPFSYVSAPEELAKGFVQRATYHFDFPREMILRARVNGVGAKGTTLRIQVDNQVVLEKVWPALPPDAPPRKVLETLSFTVPAGKHTLVVENPGVPETPDWFGIDGIDFPLEIPALAAIGQRGSNFMALWLWHRDGVFAVKPPTAVGGTLVLEDVPAGTWHMTWWDTLKGVPDATRTIDHPGGVLHIATPPISRHSAVILTRN